MKTIKQLQADPKWMALHRKTMAQRNANRREGKNAARYRAADTSFTTYAVNQLEAASEPGGRPRGPGHVPATFSDAVNDLVAEGMDRQNAVVEAAKRYPRLRERAVARANPRQRRY